MNAHVPKGPELRLYPDWKQENEFEVALKRQRKLSGLRWFSGQAAHELRNPLTAISLRLGGLEKRFPVGGLEHDETRQLARDVQRMDQILSALMAFAQPSELVLTPFRPAEFLQEAQQIAAPPWEQRCISIATEMEPTVPASFPADVVQLRRAVLNLIQNAAEAIEHHGQIVLRARTARNPWLRAARPVLALEVEDDGPGMPEEIQPRVFEPFFTTKRRGIGLGLSIAAQIVHRHRGVLDFQSRVGQGSLFRILLPAHQIRPD